MTIIDAIDEGPPLRSLRFLKILSWQSSMARGYRGLLRLQILLEADLKYELTMEHLHTSIC